MEPQENYYQDIESIYRCRTPYATKELSSILKSTAKHPEQFHQLIVNLTQTKMHSINFHHWCNIARMLVKTIKAKKDLNLQKLLAFYLIQSAEYFFPYYITLHNHKNIQSFLQICHRVQIPSPEKYTNQIHIIMHLQGKYEQKWALGLVEVINNSVLVDKKNQVFKGLKMNPYFGKFVVDHFEKIQPQLQRLLVRSQSNIEVWAQFFESLQVMPGLDRFILALLKKNKNLYANHKEVSIRLVNALARNIREEKAFIDCFEFIKGLVSGEHNAKKKIIYFQMLKGFVLSIKNNNLNPKFMNQVLVLVINSWIKFVEEQEANIVLLFLQFILPNVSQPGDEIANACKPSIKNASKYIQLFLYLVLSEVYNKQEHFEEFPTVKEIFGLVKAQLPNYMKKVEGSWHWVLPLLLFLSNNDLTFSENVTEVKSLFQDSCLALNKFQKNNAIKLIINHIKYLRKQLDEEEDDEGINLSSDICISLCILMEQCPNQRVWKIVGQLQKDEIKQIISKGLFSVLYFEIEKTQKNKGNRFISLGQFLLKSIDKISLSCPQLQKYIISASLSHYPLTKIINFKQELSPNERQHIQNLINKYLKLIIFDFSSENSLTTPHLRNIFQYTLDALLKVLYPSYLDELLSKFLEPNYYLKNLDFINQIEEQSIQVMKKYHEQYNEEKDEVKQKGLYNEPKIEEKKVYLGQLLDVKMMSEDQAKEQKFKQHFDKMILYFQKLVSLILRNIQEHQFIECFWKSNFHPLIHIAKFPDHRMYIYSIIKYNCQYVGFINKQWNIFMKYSLFFAQFFSIRGAYITPSVNLMSKCQTFLNVFLDSDFIKLQGYILLIINDMCEYILDNMQFDLSLKRLALNFYRQSFEKGSDFKNEQQLYTYLVKNINIISSSEDIESVLKWCLNKIDSKRYGEMFVDILSYINNTKALILHMICSQNNENYKPQFEDYIKLRILSLQNSKDISEPAAKILNFNKSQSKQITNFNMKGFIKKNSKDTIEKLCQFVTQSIEPDNIHNFYKLILKTGEELFNEHFDQEGLQFLPYFLTLNIDNIPEDMFKPIFQILILKYTANEDYPTLSRLSVDIGISIIKKYAPKQGEKLLLILETYLNKAKGISNIIFLGVIAPYIKGNKNIQLIEQRITELFKGDSHSEQRAIAKCMPDLMSFFKQPQTLIKNIFNNISGLEQKLQIGQSYLVAGLLKGVGAKQTVSYLQMIISSQYIAKTKSEKAGRCWLLNAFIDNFGRVIELKVIQIIELLIQYMSDNMQDIRNLSKKVVQLFVPKMSSFAVKILLPHLLSGLQNQQNWRVKISYIWILGIMANCSARQLQTSLPVIVPTLSSCLSNAHPTIRDKAAEALSLIGQTIKNPQISSSIHILIEALQNPFEKTSKAIDILLKMQFSHYIDPPSLSIIIPIVDYSLRGRVSELKEGACQVIGSICQLIQNPSDMLPYLRIISTGLKTAVCDPLSEIRGIAAMAIGKISSKIGAADSLTYFKFVLDMIEGLGSNTTEKSGAAQAYAEMICSQDYDYFEESLNIIFDKLNEVRHSQKQGYLLVFLYVPSIRKEEFEGFIKEVNENMYIFVSDQDQNLRNSAMQVAKVLINSYSLSHTDLLLEPLCDGIFQSNWRKRNAALILIGEMLNIIKGYMFHTKNSDKTYAYYKGLMAVYILKDDQLEMPRTTAHQVWNTYIQNTPKTIKSGLKTLVTMWTKFTHSANGIVFKNIVGFSSKYGQNYFLQILQHLQELSSQPLHKKGVFEVLTQFIKRLSQQFLSKETYRELVRDFYSSSIFTVSNEVREALTRSFSIFVQKMHEQEYFQNLIYPQIDRMEKLNEQEKEYSDMLHLVRDLLHTSSGRVANRLINKIMQPPLSQFKIQVITNNADKVANNLYSLFKDKPATQSMLAQIFTLLDYPEKANRLSLLVYCLNQISTRLSNNYKNQYIKMLIKNIRINAHSQNGMKSIEKLFEMVLFFLNSISLVQIESLEELIGELAPFIFKGSESLRETTHKLFLILISDHKAPQTGLYYRQLITALDNNKGSEKIWNSTEIVRDYVNILVKGLAYGSNQIMQDSLEVLKFLIKHTEKGVIQKLIMRIIGPILRVANYPLKHKQKEKLLQFLQQIYQSSYDLQIYNHQVLSVCIRLLSEYKGNQRLDEIIRLVASSLYYLIARSQKHSIIINNLLNKIKIIGEPLVRTLYYLFKKLINDKELLSKPILEKVNQEFHSILTHNEHRLSIKGIYYVSKTAARIGSHLGYPIEKYEVQLEGVTCSYEIMLNYLHHAYYTENAVPKMKRLQLFIQECPREKVYYLLKSLKLCKKKNKRTQGVFTLEYIKKLVPETLSGFEDIIDVMEEFE